VKERENPMRILVNVAAFVGATALSYLTLSNVVA
jgi:hypothetical protein